MEEEQAIQEKVADTVVNETRFICPECNDPREFRNQWSLNAHIRKHDKERKLAERGETYSARKRSDSGIETLQEKIERLRKERKPIGSPEKKWDCPMDDGYYYRVFNDDWMTRPGNIQRAQAAGYEFVENDEEKQKPKIVGTNDNGTPIRGFLMRIPQEIHDEDQLVKQKNVDMIDKQIKAGSFQQGVSDGRYIPSGGIKITENAVVPG